MTHNVILVADPGIDTAFAIALALHDPELNVLGVAATAGNVAADQATKNVQIIVEQTDPPRWPRLGAALPVEYDMDGRRLHGPDGLGGSSFPCARLHHCHPSDKLLTDLVRQHPKDVTVVVLGPLTVLARAFDRDPELPGLVQRLVCVGGAWHEPGDVGAVTEFHFLCDPVSARQVIRSGVPLLLLPLDVTRKMLFAPTDLLELPCADSNTCTFLRKIVPFGIGAASSLYGVEGFHLHDVLGVLAVSNSGVLTTKPLTIDIETRGELTRGMCVVDARRERTAAANVELAVSVEVEPVRAYFDRLLRRAQ